MFVIANTTRPATRHRHMVQQDQETPKQETHGALVVVLVVRGDAAHN